MNGKGEKEMASKVVVIKCGGSMLEEMPASFYQELTQLQQAGKEIVIVHGGGPAINELLGQLKIEPKFVQGLRVTDVPTMQAVEMVLSGSTNKKVVRNILTAKGKAWGMSGVDASLIKATVKDEAFGLVGEIMQVNPEPIRFLLQAGYVPVISPVAVSCDGMQSLNVNADISAGAIAAALEAEKLLLMTDVSGIYTKNEAGERIMKESTTAEEIEQLIADEVIYGGMIPKVQAALDALHQGVEEVVICLAEAASLHKACYGEAVGTSIFQKKWTKIGGTK
ncbi:acetylglutamate kinase [Brevibacillus daliensis]|uniref:acetylglutamate kinase n=1 Tax=Brevibacillus daliensis TaxID=2892995 RepID=UPI001E4A80EB|nr:acetylglutamate kinase [Brevibacillus daliensis]